MFKEKLMKRLDKKGAKDLDPLEKDAKMGVMKELSRQAGSMMGSKIHPMMKAEVASDSKEGLKAGLGKAKQIIEGSPEEEAGESKEEEIQEGDHDAGPAEGSAEEEAGESKSEEDAEIEAEHADHSPEELDAKIQKLIELKHKKESGKA